MHWEHEGGEGDGAQVSAPNGVVVPRSVEGSGTLQGLDPRHQPGDPDLTRSADPESLAPIRHGGVVHGAPQPFRDPGRYEILNEHGRGGLGRVSRAHDKDLGRDIAVKELLTRSPVNERRFAREAMITARLQHPGIVPIYEAGQWPDGTPFYAMKLVAGQSLRELLSERATVAERIALLHHVIAVADAMAYAHERNIIHRDLKPANVIVGDFGETVVIDWGLAKDLSDPTELGHSAREGSPDRDLTSTGSVLGTPAYMPPEQERGERVDRRADVFAIGAMLWELCSLQKVPPTDPALRRRMFRTAGIDPDLVTIIEKALAPDPARRYPHAGALAADLKAFKSGARIAARSYSLWAMLAHWTRRHRALAAAIIVAVTLLSVGGLAFVRNIAIERNRVDAALKVARRERDHARLSEASLVLDKDPNRSRALLSSFTIATPQVALLASRTRQLNAAHVISSPVNIGGLYRAPGSGHVDVRVTGALERVDPETGALVTVDRDVTTLAFAYRDGQPVYVRQVAGNPGVRIVLPGRAPVTIQPRGEIWQIVTLDDATYVLDRAGDLRQIVGTAAVLIDRDVHGVAGDVATLLVCRRNGVLEVQRRGVTVLRRRCARIKSPGSMAVVGDDFAVLGDDGTLVASRAGELQEMATELRGEYELALSERGAIALADYGSTSRTWFVRPGGDRLEDGPTRGALPFSVAADGTLVAWGYFDGMVSVLDIATGIRWDRPGITGPVSYLVIDAGRQRVISASRRDLRIWEVKQPAGARIATMPCSSFHLQPSPDGSEAALDCNDGSVWRWGRRSGLVERVHTHAGFSLGVQWFRGSLCSAGWGDGLVRCSGSRTPAIVADTHSDWVGGIRATPDGRTLVFADIEGEVFRLDDTIRSLYRHAARVFDAAVSDDGQLYASCAQDGSLAAYDLRADRRIPLVYAHVGSYCGVSWVDHELWSVGDEGTLKRWRIRDGVLRLDHVLQVSTALSLLHAAPGRWAAAEGAEVLVVGQGGGAIELRIDLGGTISAIDVSPDRRYVTASVNNEIVVIDLERDVITNVVIGSPVRQLRFLDPGLLAFSEPNALKTLRLDQLTYEPFERTPEPANRASF